MLDAAHNHMIGEDDKLPSSCAVSRGELELAQGQPDAAESMLRKTILQGVGSEGRRPGNTLHTRAVTAICMPPWQASGSPGADRAPVPTWLSGSDTGCASLATPSLPVPAIGSTAWYRRYNALSIANCATLTEIYW